MSKKENTQAQAAYTLSNEISDVRMWLDRAETIMQDINEDYFNKYDNHSEDGRVAIAWEYSRHTAKSDIVVEYLCKMRVTLDALYEQARQVGLERQKERDAATLTLKGGDAA